MGLGDITGIFSRFFVVGFYLPSFFTLVVLLLLFRGAEDIGKSDILAVGGAALLLALLLVGFRSLIWFKFSGYWFQGRHQIGKPGPSEDAAAPAGFEARALARLRETKFRRATREYRDYVKSGWGLDTWVAWPFIEAEFSERERELHVDALATVHFFQNACLGAVAIAIGCVADAADEPVRLGTLGSLVAAAGSLAAAWVFYRGAVSAVRSWGEYKIVSALRHRGDVYEHLGFRRPATFAEEHEIAREANAWLEDGGHSPDVRLRGG
jgi:hypothetical protein